MAQSLRSFFLGVHGHCSIHWPLRPLCVADAVVRDRGLAAGRVGRVWWDLLIGSVAPLLARELLILRRVPVGY